MSVLKTILSLFFLVFTSYSFSQTVIRGTTKSGVSVAVEVDDKGDLIVSQPSPTPTGSPTPTPLPNNTVWASLPQASATPTPVTTPVPGYVDDLWVTTINNSGSAAGDVIIWLGPNPVYYLPLLGLNTPVGGFILRGDGINKWAFSSPTQAGAHITYNVNIILRGLATPVPVY